MKQVASWLQNNPMVVLVMFLISLLSGVIGVVQGWPQIYKDYLSKVVELPIWLLMLFVIMAFVLLAVMRTTPRLKRPLELERISGMQFGVQQLVIDGKHFDRCEFHGTELIFKGQSGFAFTHCEFEGQRFLFDEGAALTLLMLAKMYEDEGGFREFVEHILGDVKRGGLRQGIAPK